MNRQPRDSVGHHGGNTSVTCSCGTTFVSTTAMFQHQRHSGFHTKPASMAAEAAFGCSCGKAFKSGTALAQHQRDDPSHGAAHEGTLLCTCGKAFKHEVALLQHQRDLPDHRPSRDEGSVLCGCGMRFRHAGAMLQHQRHAPEHRASVKEEPVLCGCGTVFKSAAAFAQHQEEMPGHTPLSDDIPVICTCGRTFKNATAMFQHQRDVPDHMSRDRLSRPTAPTVGNGLRQQRQPPPQQPPFTKRAPVSPSSGSMAAAGASQNILSKIENICHPGSRSQADGSSGPHQAVMGHRVDPINKAKLISNSARMSWNSRWDSFQQGANVWSAVPPNQWQPMVKLLSRSCHSTDDLLKHHYLLRPYNAADIGGLQRCKNCRGRWYLMARFRKPRLTACRLEEGHRQAVHKGLLLPCRESPRDGKDLTLGPCIVKADVALQDERTGRGVHPCCGAADRGCLHYPSHTYTGPDRRLEAKYREYAPTPAASTTVPKRYAVSLDCEMAGLQGGANAVVLLCVVDFLTGETLVNAFVRPLERVIDWRTRTSGVTSQAIAAATARGEALNGWRKAREELWKHIDADTILVGHALQHDLDVLRIVHTRVVDSAVLTKKAVGPESVRQWGLRTLCQDFLDIDIQTHGRRGHDCLEDALAAREVVLWCLCRAEELESWAKIIREDEAEQKAVREEEKRLRRQEKEQNKMHGFDDSGPKALYGSSPEQWDDDAANNNDDDNDDDDHEALPYVGMPDELAWPGPFDPWDEIAEDLGWRDPNGAYEMLN